MHNPCNHYTSIRLPNKRGIRTKSDMIDSFPKEILAGYMGTSLDGGRNTHLHLLFCFQE